MVMGRMNQEYAGMKVQAESGMNKMVIVAMVKYMVRFGLREVIIGMRSIMMNKMVMVGRMMSRFWLLGMIMRIMLMNGMIRDMVGK